MKYKTINLKERSHSQLKFISKCLDREMTRVLAEMLDQIFELFTVYKPDGSTRIFYDKHSGYLTITTSGRSNIVFGAIPNVPNTVSDKECDSKVKKLVEKAFEGEEN